MGSTDKSFSNTRQKWMYREILVREYEQEFAELPEDPKLFKLCSDAGFLKSIGKGQFFNYTWWRWLEDMKIHVECTQYIEMKEREGGFVETRRSAQSWMWRSTFIKDVTVFIWWSNLLFRDRTFSWVRIVNGINKYVTRRKIVQGNLLRRLNDDQSLL